METATAVRGAAGKGALGVGPEDVGTLIEEYRAEVDPSQA